jgi:hypothetical protein
MVMLGYNWLVKKFGLLLAWVLILVVVLTVVFGGYMAVKRFFTHGVSTEAKLGKNQTNAAITSGHDAVETIGNRQAADAEGQRTVQETKDAINRANDAGSVTDAGRSGLCRLASHRSSPECLRGAPPK